MTQLSRRSWLAGAAAFGLLGSRSAEAALPESVARIKRSLVGITTFAPTAAISQRLAGTGFAIGDGRHIITNYHVIQSSLDKPPQQLGALLPQSLEPERRGLEIVKVSPAHDLALLRLSGAPMPPLALWSETTMVEDGTAVAITGFPLGAVLGLVPATQTGIVSAHTPNISPQPNSRFLDAELLRTPRFSIYQLDLTAYPGHSGSPLYLADTGVVIGVLNATVIKSTKERVISDPSGISYAVPSAFIRDIAAQAGLAL